MRRFLGLLSLGQVALALAIGLWAMAAESLGAALAYGALLLAAPLAVTWVYCAKCPCREGGCAHVLPGLLARWLRRAPGPYARWELAVVAVVMAGLCLAPLPWLLGRWSALAAFTLLLVAAVVEIRAAVCRGCGNLGCALRRPARRP